MEKQRHQEAELRTLVTGATLEREVEELLRLQRLAFDLLRFQMLYFVFVSVSYPSATHTPHSLSLSLSLFLAFVFADMLFLRALSQSQVPYQYESGRAALLPQRSGIAPRFVMDVDHGIPLSSASASAPDVCLLQKAIKRQRKMCTRTMPR
jgi:hypothetical protein